MQSQEVLETLEKVTPELIAMMTGASTILSGDHKERITSGVFSRPQHH